MKTTLQILDRLLTSIVTSCVIFFFSFSFMTGKFPPHKGDMIKAFSLLKQMAGLTQDYNQANAEMTSQPPNLDQIIQLQRLALRKSEVTQELTNLMVRFPKGIPSIEAAAKIQEAAKHLDDSQAILVQVNQDLQKMMQTPSADTAQAAPVVPAAAKVGP